MILLSIRKITLYDLALINVLRQKITKAYNVFWTFFSGKNWAMKSWIDCWKETLIPLA